MLLEQAANRLRAYLLDKFPDATCTGLVLPWKPRGEEETALFEHGTPIRVTLDSGVKIQFIIRGLNGGYEPVLTGGIGQNYNRIGRLVLVVYTEIPEVVDRVEPALTALRELRLTGFDINPQSIAGSYLFLGHDFNFERPIAAFELDVTERIKNAKCELLPTALCPPVEVYRDGVLFQRVPAGLAFSYATDCPPVTQFNTIQNSLAGSTVIMNAI